MITVINNKNSKKYEDLFTKAEKALGGTTSITNLETYFRWMKDLADIDIKFTMLPLDEEPLEVDATNRTIKIPANFSKLVGVKGDHTAEIVYFKINRYFDAIDLDTQKVCVEWRHSKDPESHISGIFVKDQVSQPGYLLLGWIIEDDMTFEPGTLEFALRFYSLDEETEKVSYSFSTLPAKMVISDTIALDIADEAANNRIPDSKALEEMIKKRLTNSHIYGGEFSATPIFLVDLTSEVYEGIGNGEKVLLPYINDLDKNLIVELMYDETTPTELLGQAYSEDAGDITYKWYRANWTANKPTTNSMSLITENETDEGLVEEVYIKTADTELDERKTYYIEDRTSGTLAYVEFDGTVDENGPDMSILFERYAKFTPQTFGYYQLEATNTVGLNDENVITNPSYARSVLIEIPGAKKLKLDVGPHPSVKNEDFIDGSGFTLEPINLEEPDGGTISYSWYKDGELLIGETEETYFAQDNGKYSLVVSNFRNGDTKDSEPAIYIVSDPAEEPVIIAYGDNSVVPGGAATFTLDSSILSNYVSIIWKRGSAESPGTVITEQTVKYVEGEDYIVNYTPKVRLDGGTLGADELQPGNSFYAEVYNVYNTDTSDFPAYSNKFFITTV